MSQAVLVTYLKITRCLPEMRIFSGDLAHKTFFPLHYGAEGSSSTCHVPPGTAVVTAPSDLGPCEDTLVSPTAPNPVSPPTAAALIQRNRLRCGEWGTFRGTRGKSRKFRLSNVRPSTGVRGPWRLAARRGWFPGQERTAGLLREAELTPPQRAPSPKRPSPSRSVTALGSCTAHPGGSFWVQGTRCLRKQVFHEGPNARRPSRASIRRLTLAGPLLGQDLLKDLGDKAVDDHTGRWLGRGPCLWRDARPPFQPCNPLSEPSRLHFLQCLPF